MKYRLILVPIFAAMAVAVLGGCAYEPTYSYVPVPCAPVAGAAAAGENAPAPTSLAPAPNAQNIPGAPAAAAAPQSPAQYCVVAVPNDIYAADYAYWDDDWPYYGWPYSSIGFGGFIGSGFDRGFHFHRGFNRFHGAGFHGGFHRGFHGSGFHGHGFRGGFHGGGFHGGGRH